jgi:hypothetical protein
MSISFSAIKGYQNKVNLGDTGYNTTDTYDKNKIYSGGNPTNWNSNHNIKKDPSKSTHTRYIEKVGSEVINNVNRSESFQDRVDQFINHYPTGRNLMATGIDYGGNPYKIGDSSKTCKFNVGDYVSLTNNYALSRKPVQYVQTTTNKKDSETFTSNIQRKPNLKSIKDHYVVGNAQTNKKEKYSYNTDNLNRNVDKSIKHDNLHYKINSNLINTNNFNNHNNRKIDKKILNENYRIVDTNINKRSQITKDNTIQNRKNTNQYISENYKVSNVNTNLHKNFNELDTQQRNVRLENKLQISEGYNNNRNGLRKQTTNLAYKL